MKALLLICTLLTGYIATAQTSTGNSITGTIIDSASREPLEYATITLFNKGDKTPVTGTTTDKSGVFNLTDLPEGTFDIVFEFIGYNPLYQNDITITKKNFAVDLKKIVLGRRKGELQGVTVISQGKLLENKIDKMVFNAEKDLTSQSGVATDVLKKIPMVSVDADGNVQLSGSSGVRFLINGKPSTAFGSNITDVLQTIPASQIKSVEVITNPGAKYDAAGLGGIINIILKTNNAKGYNGNLSLSAGSRMENGSYNMNIRQGSFGMNAYISGNKRLKADIPYSSERLTTDSGIITSFKQAGTSSFERHGVQAGTGFDWNINKSNNISGSISYSVFGNNGEGSNNQVNKIKGSSLPEELSLMYAGNNHRYQDVDASLNYKKTFAEDQELELAMNTTTGTIRNSSDNYQKSMPADSIYYATNSNNPGKEKETEFTVDYSQPLKEDVILGIGGKINLYDISSSSDVHKYQPFTKTYVPDTYLSNSLNYHQKVYALYSELSFPVYKLFNAKIGGRYERTEINSFYSNARQQAKVPGYNTIVPSIFLSRKLGEHETIKLSYSKRIERPDYHDLNPFINTNDPKNLSAGNPNLKPEIGHRVELSYSHEMGALGSLMATLFYRENQQDIQPYIVYYPSLLVGDSVYNDVSLSTRQNIGMEKNAGMNFFGDFHFNPKIGLRSNLFFFRRHTINVIDPGLNANSFNYRFNVNATYQFTSTVTGEFFGNFNSARHEAQGTYPSYTTYTVALRRQFWKKKGSLAFTATNPFSKYVNQRTELFGTNFTVNSLRQIPSRSFGLNFSWKFGKLEFSKKKEGPDMNLNAPGE